MDEAVIIKELGDVIANLRKIRRETWGDPSSDFKLLPIDEEVAMLEDILSQMTYKDGWNGVHPMGQS